MIRKQPTKGNDDDPRLRLWVILNHISPGLSRRHASSGHATDGSCLPAVGRATQLGETTETSRRAGQYQGGNTAIASIDGVIEGDLDCVRLRPVSLSMARHLTNWEVDARVGDGCPHFAMRTRGLPNQCPCRPGCMPGRHHEPFAVPSSRIRV